MITITAKPYNFSGFRQRHLIVQALSDEILQDGFQYKVVVTGAGLTLFTGYCRPNNVGVLVFDLHPVITHLGSQFKRTATQSIHSAFYATGGTIGFNERYPVNPDPASCPTLSANPITIVVTEAWKVGGILTDATGTGTSDTANLILFNRTAQYREGYRPNPNPSFALATDERILSDREPGDHLWQQAAAEGQFNAKRIYIAAQSKDYGLLSIPYVAQANKTTRDLPSYLATQARITLIPAAGSPTTVTTSLTSLQDGVIHLPFYPANIQVATNTAFDPIKPSANPNWKCYIIDMRRADNSAASATYVIYNAERYNEVDCRQKRIRIGWINSRGGYDYQNFIKTHEFSYESDRKIVQKAAGNYANASSTGFSFAPEDRGFEHTRADVKEFLTINSDWLTDGEFRLLKFLATAPDVHLVNEDGSHTPVLITDTTYTQRVKNGQQYNLTLRLQIAHNLHV